MRAPPALEFPPLRRPRGIALAAWFLLAALVSACGGEAPGGSPGVDARHVALDGQSNFRDLGGYRTADGRVVKSGVVYRSGTLSKLSDADVATLNALGIRTVLNFLTDEEIRARGADRLPEGAKLIQLPLDGGDHDGGLVEVVLAARRTGDFSKVPADLNPGIHRFLIRDAENQYAALLRSLADPESRPAVFHCSHGVHRTGTAAAVLLTALGVPWETIREDYLLSNEYRQAEIEKRLEQLRDLAAEHQGVSPEEVDTTNMRAFYVLEGRYVDAALEEAVERFGSMENYIRSGLGITEAEIERLRAELLE